MARLRMHRLVAFEDVGVERGEELLVQRGHRAQQIGFGHHEADIEQRRSLADHADVDAIERIENPARHARRVADVLAHQADDDAIVLHRGFGELAQVGQDELDVAGVVDGQRDADFAGGHHIDGGFVAVENLEDAVQEALGHQHARGVNVDRSDLALTGDRFYGVFAMHRFGGDARSGHVGAAKVDLVLSDMAPNMAGIDAVDQPRSMYLAELAVEFASQVLAPGGDLLVKLFQGSGFEEIIKNARSRYGRVVTKKPKASRTRSPEIYLLARQFGMV